MSRLLIFELDGGTWQVIEPLLAMGQLPNVARLIRRGARGTLRSVPPFASPALWTTIYTGQPRERHGVETFNATSQDVRYRRLWDIAHAHGIRCGVCGSLVTWPPYDVGGFMIPDIMSRDATTIPPRFAPLQELVVQYPRGRSESGFRPTTYARYGIGLLQAGIRLQTMFALAWEVISSALLRRSRQDSYWRRALLMQELYADAFLRLHRAYQPGLSTYHYHAADTLSHWYWRQEEAGGEVVRAAYQAADRLLGRFLRSLGGDLNVLVISDHGFRASDQSWSRYKGRLVRWIEVLGLEGVVTPTLLAQQHFLHFRDPERVEPIADLLRGVTFKDTGEPVLSQVVVRDRSLYFTPPRLAGEGRTVVIPRSGEYPFEELFANLGQVNKGVHDREGVVILSGPSVRPGGDLGTRSICDVTPTALALLGLPVARDMVGQVWGDVLRPEALEQHPVTYVDTYVREEMSQPALLDVAEDNEDFYQRLSDLGYL